MGPQSERKTNTRFGRETKSIRVYNSSRNWRWKTWGITVSPTVLELGRIVVPDGCIGVLNNLWCNLTGFGDDGDGNLIPFGCNHANGVDWWLGLFGGSGEPHFGLRICKPAPSPDAIRYAGPSFPGEPLPEVDDWHDNRAESCFAAFHNRRIVVVDENTMIRFFVGLPLIPARTLLEGYVPCIRASMDCAIGPIALFDTAMSERVGL